MLVLGLCGECFRSDLGWIRECIDRLFATIEWLNMFTIARLHHLASSTSDYCYLMLRTNQRLHRSKHKKQFRFESIWLKDEKCGDIVRQTWAEGMLMGVDNSFSICIDNCHEALLKWNLQEFDHVGRKLAKAQDLLQALEARSVGLSNTLEVCQQGKRLTVCWIWRKQCGNNGLVTLG